MSHRMVSKAAVDQLRLAAGTLDWNEWRSALDNALAHVAPDAMLALAEQVIRNGLPTFERNHPGESWPRRALDGQTSELGPVYSGPGGGNFASGVEELLDARTHASDPARCRPAIIEAICNAIMAELCAIWGAEHPEGWRRSYEAGFESSAPSTTDPMWNWHQHPSVRAAKLAQWNNVADRLEAL